jgi:hypothetical protein
MGTVIRQGHLNEKFTSRIIQVARLLDEQLRVWTVKVEN